MIGRSGIDLPFSVRPDVILLTSEFPHVASFCSCWEPVAARALKRSPPGNFANVKCQVPLIKWDRATAQTRDFQRCQKVSLKKREAHRLYGCDDWVLVRPASRGWMVVRAGPEQTSASSVNSTGQKGFFSSVLRIPRSLGRQVLMPLSNFGFGKRSVWEGGVGLFLISGAVLLWLTVGWLRGYQLRSGLQKYQAVIEFSRANGICVGTPLRIRGVEVGKVIKVTPSLNSIDVFIEVSDAKVVIPRTSLVEVNQSGLLMETLIDITPYDPIPQPSVSPLDPYCSDEGLIVCDRQKIQGEQGVNLDELVGIFTKLAKEVDEIGIGRVYSLADRLSKSVEDAKPLLNKVERLAENLEPLLKEVQNGGLLKEVEQLAKALSEASVDLRRLNDSVLTPENTELLRQSVSTLTKTLKNIESISQDVSGLTGDASTRYNLKHLIESLSRLMAG